MPFVEELSKFPTSAILIYMLGLFLSFGLISSLFEDEGALYNLTQGAFIAVVTAGVLFLARYMSRRSIASRVKLQPSNPKNV